jgi:hypothetical protein
MTHDELQHEVHDLRQRLDRLEQYLGLPARPPTPGFDPLRFQRILQGYLARLWILFLPMFALIVVGPLAGGYVSETKLFGLPVFNAGFDPALFGMPVGIIALGGGAVGVVSFGGLAIGVLAFGGGAFGVVAVGGGAVGLVAFGGGALGVLAAGGGAAGYVAVGSGAVGTYVLAGDGRGRYVLDRKRQDDAAIRLFCRYLPRLREAFTAEPGQPATAP